MRARTVVTQLSFAELMGVKSGPPKGNALVKECMKICGQIMTPEAATDAMIAAAGEHDNAYSLPLNADP